jgi:hypothetical protein
VDKLDHLRFDSEEESHNPNKSRDRSKGNDSTRDKNIISSSARNGSDKMMTDRLESDRIPSERLAFDRADSKYRKTSVPTDTDHTQGYQESHGQEVKRSKENHPNDRSKDNRSPGDSSKPQNRKHDEDNSQGRRDSSQSRSPDNRLKTDKKRSDSGIRNRSDRESSEPHNQARRDGHSNIESNRNNKPSSREPSARELARRDDAAYQEYRESTADYRSKPKSREPSARELARREDAAYQEYRESRGEFKQKPKSREASGRDLPPRTDAASQEYRESYMDYKKPPSVRDVARRDDAGQIDSKTTTFRQERRQSKFAEDLNNQDDYAQGLAPRDSSSRHETKTSNYYYKRPSTDNLEDEKRSSRKNSQNPDSRVERESRKSFDDRDDSNRNKTGSKRQSYEAADEIVDSHQREDSPSVQLLVPPRKSKNLTTRYDEQTTVVQNIKILEPEIPPHHEFPVKNNSMQTSQITKTLLGVPKSIEQSKLIDPLVIPIFTYPKLKNFRKKGIELEEDSSHDSADEQSPDDAKIKEEIKAAERAQNVDEILVLACSIINDLETANGRHHPYVSNLAKMHNDVEAYREDLKQTEPSPPAAKKLDELIEKLKKLEVKEQKYASKNEKNKLEGLMRRKSMQRILTENVGENPNIAGKSITSPDRTTSELENYVVTFLKDYSDRVSRLNTPTSTAFAEAANDTIELIPQIEKERPKVQHHEFLRLLAHTIHQRFHDDATSATLQSPKTPKDIGAENNNVVEFGHFLRSVNKLGQIAFKELDDMVSEPSCKINLFKMREELIEQKKVDPTKEKENDLTTLNGFKDDKKAIEELIVNLGKEILPPLNFVENRNLDDSVPHVQFFDIKKQDSFNFGPGPTYVDNSGFDDDFSFTPTTKKIEENGTETKKPPALRDLSQNSKHNQFNHIAPKVFESEDETDHFRPTSMVSATESDTARRNREEQEKNLVDEVEFQIEKVQDEQATVKDIKEQIKEESKRPAHPDKVPTSLLDSVHNTLDRIHEFEEYSQTNEPLYLELSETLGSNSEPKGFLRIWPKYMRELARLKKAVSDMIKEMQKCAEGKVRESKIQVVKLEEAAEEAREEAENANPKDNPENAKEFEDRAKIYQDEARRKEEEAEKLDRIRKALAKATLALAPTTVEKKVEENAKKVAISPAQAVRKLTKLEVAQKQTEQKEKKEELGDTVEKLEDLINQYKIIEESTSPVDTERKALTSSRKTFEEPPQQVTRPKKDSGSVRLPQKKQNDPEAIIKSMVIAEMALEEQRDTQDGPKEVSVTKIILQHTLQQMRALARAILSAIESAKDFDQRRAGMTPLDRKSEAEQTQNQYEFARNGMLSVLAKPETDMLLKQRENLPILARAMKRECERLVEVSKEPHNREKLETSTKDFYDALVPIKFDDKDEVEKIKEMIEGIKEEEKIKKEVDNMKDDIAKPKRDRTMADLIVLIKGDINRIEKLMKDPESKISPIEVKNMEKIADQAKLMLSHVVPPAELILQVKKFARGGSVLLPEEQADIPGNLDKNNDRLAEMMLKEKEFQMKKAAEELGNSFIHKGIDMKKDDLQANPDTKESYVLTPGGKLTKSQVGEHARAASALIESKYVFHPENIDKALGLEQQDKTQLQAKLLALKKAVEDCVETAEEELFSKAVGVEGIVYERKFEESSNPMIERMENKLKDLKKAVDQGDRKDQITHIVRDVVQANQRDLENKVEDGALLSPRWQGQVQESLEKLEKSAKTYENIKKSIKESMLPLIKKTEVLLGLRLDEHTGQDPVLAVVIPLSEGMHSSAMVSDYYTKDVPRSEAENSLGRIDGMLPQNAYERKMDPNDLNMRRNKKPRKIREIAGMIEDDSREFFSYNVFSEGENLDHNYDSHYLKPKLQNSSVELHTDDKIDEESHDSSDEGGYERDHYTEQESEAERYRAREEQEYTKTENGEEEQYKSQPLSPRNPTSRSQLTPRSAIEEHISKTSKRSEQKKPDSQSPSFLKHPADSAKEEEYFSDIFNKDGQNNQESEGRYSEYFNSKKNDEENAAVNPMDQNQKPNEYFSKEGKSDSHRSEPVQKIQTHFVSPKKDIKPRRNKTYYVEDAVPNPGKKDKPLVPVLLPIVFPASTDSSESGPSDVDSMESFYIERKKQGRRVYERKKRPLREGEARNQLKPVEGETMLSAVLQESSEWNRGKKVFKKLATLVDIRQPPKNDIKERKLDYFDVVGIDEETGERKVQQKETKVKSVKPTEDQQNKAVQKGLRFAIMIGADKEYKVIKLNDLDDNPLDASSHGTSDSKVQGASKPNSSFTEPVIPVIEKLPILFRDLPVLNEMRVKPVRTVSNPEGLQMFLRHLESIPNSYVSIWEQTDDFIDNKPVLTQFYKVPGPSSVDKCNKILENLAKDGKLSGVDPADYAMVGPGTGKLDRTMSSVKPGSKLATQELSPVIPLRPIEGLLVEQKSAEPENPNPIYMLQEHPDSSKLIGESDTTAAEDLALRALEELKRALERVGKIGDIGGLYARIAKEAIEAHPNGQQQMQLIDDLFQAIEQEARRRGQTFEDNLFPPGAGSMVNNSLKSTQPYKHCDWLPSSTQFEVGIFLI